MNVFVLLNTKEDILKNVGNRAVLGHHWLPSYFFSYYGSQWCPKTAWLQTFFRISSFVFGRTKKFIQVWNYLRMSKWWQNFHFGWTIPLICIIRRQDEKKIPSKLFFKTASFPQRYIHINFYPKWHAFFTSPSHVPSLYLCDLVRLESKSQTRVSISGVQIS